MTYKEAQDIRRKSLENLEENVSITPYTPWEPDREYAAGYAHASGYHD